MDTILYNEIKAFEKQISNSTTFDPWQYTEHQAVNLAVNEPQLTTLMNVTGKGMLEEAIFYCTETSENVFETPPRLVITVDGVIIFDVTTSSNDCSLGIYPTSSATYSQPNYAGVILAGTEHIIGVPIQLFNFSFFNAYPAKLSFPNSSPVSISTSGVIGIEQPIYFKNSLLIQISGVSNYTSGKLCAFAKARY
jgi:hypothetical protein